VDPRGWSLRLRLAAAILSGLALTTAFPPFDAGVVAYLALVPLALALRGTSGPKGGLVAAVFAFTFFGLLLRWIFVFGALAWSALALAHAIYFVPVGVGAALLGRRGWLGRVLGLPLLWAGFEVLRARWPLGGLSWGDLGYSQVDGSGAAWARIGGVFFLGAVVVLVNALVSELLAGERRIGAAAGAVGLVVLPAFLPLGLAGPLVGEGDVAAVQGNVPRDRFSGFGRGGRVGPEDTVIVDNHLRVTEQLAGAEPPDLIVWPENALDRDPRRNPEIFAPIVRQVERIGAPLLVGAILDEGSSFTNSNLVVQPDGRVTGRYDKIHLVPFGEYVPWDFVRRINPVLASEVPVDGRAGERLTVFPIGDMRVGSVICFESTYPHLARNLVRSGAEVIVVTTNNASYGTSPAAAQHLAMSRMRAVENGRAVVHAAISGESAIIDPNGRVRAHAGLFEPALLRGTVPLAAGRTPYARFGAWIEAALVIAGLGALGRGIAGRRDAA